MKNGSVVKINDNTVRFIESTCDFSKFKKIYMVFDSPVEDLKEIEWWESHLDMLGVHRALVQLERHYVDGTIKVLGYNIITDKPLAREI